MITSKIEIAMIWDRELTERLVFDIKKSEDISDEVHISIIQCECMCFT